MSKDSLYLYTLKDSGSDFEQKFNTNAPKEVVTGVVNFMKAYGKDYNNDMVYDILEALGYTVTHPYEPRETIMY